MSLGSIFKSIGNWFAKAWKNIKQSAAPLAVTITQGIKLALDSGLVKVITDLIPGNLDNEIVAFLQTAIPKALAIELALEGVPDNATPEQIQEFILLVEKSIGGKSWQEQSAFWTKLGVNIYNQIQADLNKDPNHANISFADMVAIIEQAYVAYKAHQAGEDDLTDTNPDK